MATLFVSCNKEAAKDTITIPNQSDLTPYFDVTGGSKSVLFTASSDWVAVVLNDSENKWVSVSPSNGTGGEWTLFITAKENMTTDDRTATIEIRCGTAKKQILATQKQKNALTLTKSKYDVKAEGETIQIEVKANVNYTVTIDEKSASWIEKTQTKSMETTTFNLVVSKNEDVTKREGKVVVSDGTLSETISINQEGSAPAIILSEHEYVIPSPGETIEIEVAHNVNVSVSKSADWITLVSTKGMVTNTYTFSISANTGYDGREAEIQFKNTANGLTETVKIVQLQKDAIVYAKNEYFVPRKGGNISIIVGHDVEFATSINVGWIAEVDTKAFTTDTIKFYISENTSGQKRNGEITFTSADEKIKQKVKVNQSDEDYTNLSAEGSANCYIVSAPGMYGFNGTVKGNSTESVGIPVSAEVLWESFGTDVAPKVGDIINNVSIEGGIVYFSTPETLKNGNAVIAVKDNSGTILWSWHIWVCEGYDPVATRQLYSSGYYLMDRYLGALSSVPGNSSSIGLLYQWGRKDPFTNKTKTVNTSTTQTSNDNGNMLFAISHPNTFIQGISSTKYDWLFASRDDSLWSSNKTKNDPCPLGWHVSEKNCFSGFPTGYGNESYYDRTNRGWIFGSDFSTPDCWYPLCGEIEYNGLYKCEAQNIWTSTPNVHWGLGLDWQINFHTDIGRSNALTIRCSKD